MPAWITLLTQPSYLKGVRTLNKSLRNNHTRYSLVVMVTENIDTQTRRLLADEGCLVRQVAHLAPHPSVPVNYANPRFSEVWTKMAAWRITEFGRLAFVDADMLVIKNMDEVFDLPLPDGHIAAATPAAATLIASPPIPGTGCRPTVFTATCQRGIKRRCPGNFPLFQFGLYFAEPG